MYGKITLKVTSVTPDGESDDIVLSQPTMDADDHQMKLEIMADSIGNNFPQALREIGKKQSDKKGRK